MQVHRTLDSQSSDLTKSVYGWDLKSYEGLKSDDVAERLYSCVNADEQMITNEKGHRELFDTALADKDKAISQRACSIILLVGFAISLFLFPPAALILAFKVGPATHKFKECTAKIKELNTNIIKLANIIHEVDVERHNMRVVICR